MKRLFDPEVIRTQLAHLQAERDRISAAIESLKTALHAIEKIGDTQTVMALDGTTADTTLNDAVRRCCVSMIDGITRQRVISALEKNYPGLRPKSPSVAAVLVNLTKGDEPFLRVAIEGKGRRPAYYSTEADMVLKLSAEEISELLDESATRGTGGWQSLWTALLRHFDKASGTITMTPELRGRLYNYFHFYGQGGWQNRSRRIFRRELPHLFTD